MQKGRKVVAWWLLVLLVRVLTPEAAVLRLHFHHHTDEKSGYSLVTKTVTKAVLSAKHQHCHVEQLYNAAFQPSGPVRVEGPVRLLTYAVYRPQAPVCQATHLLDGACLRGPPAFRA